MVISNTSQQISVSLIVEAIWSDLLFLQSSHPGPRGCIGDFNVVLGSHEVRRSHLPLRIACEEFKSFTDNGNWTHMATMGAEYTWSNKRIGSTHTKKRLDRSICNDA